MELISKVYGKIQYEQNEVITFEKGMPGFDGLNKFILRDIEGNPLFKVMHSLEDESVAFVLISPFECVKEYEIKLGQDVLDNLQIEDSKDVLLYAVVTISSVVENITANLKAPIVLNCNKMKAEQIILNKEEYLVKHSIFEGV